MFLGIRLLSLTASAERLLASLRIGFSVYIVVYNVRNNRGDYVEIILVTVDSLDPLYGGSGQRASGKGLGFRV